MSASAGRVLLIHKGNYDSSATYNPMDEVLYEGSTYVCKATSTDNAPTNTTYWQIMAQKGADGSAGQGIPTGGTTGQVLTKHSNANYDVEWSDVELDALSIAEAQEYGLIPGKNLAVFNPFVGTESSVSVSVSDASTGELTLNGSASGSAIICISDPIANPSGSEDGSLNLKAGTYVLSSPQYSALSASFYLAVVDKNGNKKASFQPQSASDDHVEFTLNSDTNGLFIAIYLSSGAYFSSQDLQVMICTLADWNKSHTYEPYYVPVKDSMFKRSEQGVLGAKNFIPYPFYETTKTVNGVTFTDNGDGTVTVNGTATAQSEFILATPFTLNIDKPLIISGSPSGADANKYLIQMYDKNPYTTTYNVTEGDFAIPSIYGKTWEVKIMICNGAVCNNLVFKPMIRLASDPDDTYQPYAMTNKELTDAVTVEVLQCSDFMSGVTVNRNSVRKMGELVILDIDLTIPSASSGDLLCVLPSTCKPWDNLILTGVNRSNNTFACFTVKSNGQISTRTVITNSDLAMHAVYTTN